MIYEITDPNQISIKIINGAKVHWFEAGGQKWVYLSDLAALAGFNKNSGNQMREASGENVCNVYGAGSGVVKALNKAGVREFMNPPYIARNRGLRQHAGQLVLQEIFGESQPVEMQANLFGEVVKEDTSAMEARIVEAVYQKVLVKVTEDTAALEELIQKVVRKMFRGFNEP